MQMVFEAAASGDWIKIKSLVPVARSHGTFNINMANQVAIIIMHDNHNYV